MRRINHDRRRRWRGLPAAAAAVSLIVGGVVASAPATALGPLSPLGGDDPLAYTAGTYYYFQFPSAAASRPAEVTACGANPGAGAELQGNFGPAGVVSNIAIDQGGGAQPFPGTCTANFGLAEPGLYWYQYVATTMPGRVKTVFCAPVTPSVTSHPNWHTLWFPDLVSSGWTM